VDAQFAIGAAQMGLDRVDGEVPGVGDLAPVGSAGEVGRDLQFPVAERGRIDLGLAPDLVGDPGSLADPRPRGLGVRRRSSPSRHTARGTAAR
jgi:hypothetical protein